MQEMQSSNCRRYGIMAQMWVVSVILLLTTAVFTINAEQQHIELSSVPRAHLADDGLQVSKFSGYIPHYNIYCVCMPSFQFFV